MDVELKWHCQLMPHSRPAPPATLRNARDVNLELNLTAQRMEYKGALIRDRGQRDTGELADEHVSTWV